MGFDSSIFRWGPLRTLILLFDRVCMNDVQLGWVAGILDGEGSISMDKVTNGWRVPTLSVVSTDIEILNELQQCLGGHISTRRDKRPTAKPSWNWKIRGGVVVLKHLVLLAPHLRCPKKKARANFLIEKYPSMSVRNGVYSAEMVEQKRAFESEFYEL